jgi:hypothetical protein
MLYIFTYKIVCILAGLCIIFLGYMLFLKGIFGDSGDVEGGWHDYKLIVRKAAPGTYFVLFGSLIIAATIFKGLENDEKVSPVGGHDRERQTQQEIDSLKKKDTSLLIK